MHADLWCFKLKLKQYCISPLSDSQKNKREFFCCLFFYSAFTCICRFYNLVRRVHCLLWQVEHLALKVFMDKRIPLYTLAFPITNTSFHIQQASWWNLSNTEQNTQCKRDTYVLPHFIKVDVEMKFKGSFRINYIARVSITVGKTKLILHWLLSADQPLRIAKHEYKVEKAKLKN